MLLFSFGLVLIVGLICSYLATKIRIPHIIGLLLAGFLLGPHGGNILHQDLLIISPSLRKFALFIILLRVGLTLSLQEIKNLGMNALRLTLFPALFEIFAYTLLAHYFFHLSFLDSAILGSVIAAVSPAIIVPHMIKLLDKPYNKQVPRLLLSASSLDDILVILIFSTLLTVSMGEQISLSQQFFYVLPLSLFLGAFVGYGLAKLLEKVNAGIKHEKSSLLVVLLSIVLLLGTLEDFISIPFSGLIAVMIFALSLSPKIKAQSRASFAMLWHFAEIWLFVLVGSQLNITLLQTNLFLMISIIFVALLIRMIGVFVALAPAKLTQKEKLFCAISFLPKATVQASIGSLALEAGLASGEIILTMAILAILITAPLGAMLMEMSEKKLLS